MPYIEVSKIDDVDYIAKNLRQADLNELLAQGVSPQFSLIQGYRCSDRCYTLFNDNNVPMAIFGTAPVPELEEQNAATIWLLGTPEIENNKMYFLRKSKEWFDFLTEPFDIVFNVCDARNELHLSWLKWLGVKFTEDIEINGYKFKQFYLDINYNEVW